MRFLSLIATYLSGRLGQLKGLYDSYVIDKSLLTPAINFYVRIDARTRATSNEASLYLAALWLLLPLIFTIIVQAPYKVTNYANWVFWTFLFVTATGLLIEMYRWAEKIRTFIDNNLIGKSLITGVAAASGAFSLAYTSTIINSFTKVASTTLPYTLTLVAIPATLVLTVLFLTAISAIIGIQTLANALVMTIFNAIEIAMMIFRGNFKIAGSDALSQKTLINFMRLLGCVVLISTVTKFSEPYENGLNWLARNFAYGYEMQKFDRCAREGEKVIRINDEEILSARDPSHFETRPCPIGK